MWYEYGKDINTHLFEVESEKTYDFYEVELKKNRSIIDTNCTCTQFRTVGSCKHIVACLIHHKDVLFVVDSEVKKLQISKSILEEFYITKTKEIKLKKQLGLSVEFSGSYYSSSVYWNFKIGDAHLYSLNNKLNRFLDVYNDCEGELEFGKKLTYAPERYSWGY